MFSGRKSARSDAGARFAASVAGNTGVEVFSGKIGKPRVSNLRPCCRFFQRKCESELRSRRLQVSRGQRQRLQVELPSRGLGFDMGIVGSWRAIEAAAF